jgi:homoserine O-acetyltransferase
MLQTAKIAHRCRPSLFSVPLPSLTGEARERLPNETSAALSGPDGAPIIVVLGGISGTRHACHGVEGECGWWHEVFGEGRPAGCSTYRILGIDFVADDGGRFAPSTYDQAAIIKDALSAIGEDEPFAIVGASYGGMVALAYAERFRPRLTKIVAINAGAQPHAAATAARCLQRQVVALASTAGAPDKGLALARAMAMMTYRTQAEFGERFAGGIEGSDPLSTAEPLCYLRARGEAFVQHMSAGRFLSLSASIDRHTVDATRMDNEVLIVATAEDQVVPLPPARQLAQQLGPRARLKVISSLYGHDSFLKEPDTIVELVDQFLHSAS